MKLTIYTNKDDKGWLKELKKYAKSNKWSVSLAVREILAKNFPQQHNPLKNAEMTFVSDLPEAHAKKLDTAEWESKMSSKVRPVAKGDTYDEKIKNCDQLRIVDGKYDCYKFNNGIEHQPFCKQYCWTRKDMWGKKVRL